MREFPVVMRGYSRRDVDELFMRIDTTLTGGTTTAAPVTAAEVRATTFRVQLRGYAPRAVDQAIDAALQELQAREV